jgi:rhamnulokinase/L-fuculokinase
LLAQTDKVLFTPDLLNYFLTGRMQSEYTIASTSELLNADDRAWDEEIIKAVGLRRDMFCELVKPGASCGKLSGQIRDELGVGDIEVMSVASHDTASVVLAVPAQENGFIFLSCGTWSLLGTELDAPCNNEEAMRCKFTNEGGVSDKILFMKNIMGSWLLQESKRHWKAEGKDFSYGELDARAENALSRSAFIDVDDPEFMNPVNAPEAVRSYCGKLGWQTPSSEGEIVRCVYESLALKYRRTIEELERCVNRTYREVYMVGGGTQSALMCRLTADVTGKTIVVGSPEAAAQGNIALQFIANGEIKDIRQARRVIADTEPTKVYEPRGEASAWDEPYARYMAMYGPNRI